MNASASTILSLAQTVAALARMERAAIASGKSAVAIGMHPKQWGEIVNFTMHSMDLKTVPPSLWPKQIGALGDFHGKPVLACACDGVALFTV